MEKAIVHLDLDSFFVSVERLKNTSLLHKPLIIGGLSDRAVVASCSYETRKFGVRSAMPMKMALKLCPEAIVLRGDMDEYSKYSRLVTAVIEAQAPLFEKSSIDEHYLDITGMDRFYGCLKWTQKLRHTITKETGLPISFGLSVNKTMAKMATREAKPNGELAVFQRQVRPFLNPLPISRIPGLGEKTEQKLVAMGVRHIEQLSLLPVDYMRVVFGKNGLGIWEKANGIHETPVLAYSERKSIGKELTYQKDTTDETILKATLYKMAEEVGHELRRKGKMAGGISIKLRYSNFDTYTKEMQIPFTTADHDLYRYAWRLFEQLHSRRMLIRLIGVRATQLVGGAPQLSLFEERAQQNLLYNAMDRIKVKYGEEAIHRASSIAVAAKPKELALPPANMDTVKAKLKKSSSSYHYFGHRTDNSAKGII